jgi:hypothetical protein
MKAKDKTRITATKIKFMRRAKHIFLMMKAVQTLETLVNSYQSTQHYNPEDSHLLDS